MIVAQNHIGQKDVSPSICVSHDHHRVADKKCKKSLVKDPEKYDKNAEYFWIFYHQTDTIPAMGKHVNKGYLSPTRHDYFFGGVPTQGTTSVSYNTLKKNNGTEKHISNHKGGQNIEVYPIYIP